ncbi:MAG: hypothetical protein RR854_01430, partial [Muribaculaceae bacterium]
MSIKISKAAKDLNVGTQTLIEFLNKKNITVDSGPNARIEDEHFNMLASEFKSDMDTKIKSEIFSSERQKEKVKPVVVVEPAAPAVVAEAPVQEKKPKVEEYKTTIAPAIEPKIVGKIDIDNLGKQNSAHKNNATQPATHPYKKENKPEVVAKHEHKQDKPKVEVPKKEAPKQEAHKQEKPKVELPKTEAPKAKVEAPKVVNPVVKVEAPKKEEPEIYTMSRRTAAPSVNIVGKIDLSAINQQTRPKKKTK